MLKNLTVKFLANGLALLALYMFVPAQTTPAVRVPRASQKASVMQTIGVTDLTIIYSRPAVKGRKVWGDPLSAAPAGTGTLDGSTEKFKDAPLVAYGRVWRAGANEATVFTVTDDVLINGQKLAAGSYSLHAIPGKDEWTIIFNRDAGQWGSFSYDEKKDALRVKAKPRALSEEQEWLIYTIPVVSADRAEVVIRWEKIAVPFTVEVPNVQALTQTKIEASIAANPTDWRLPLNAAIEFAGNDERELALKWVEQSIGVKATFQNLSAKAGLLFALGRREEAFSVAETAIRQGKADQVDTSKFEKRLAALRAGKTN